MNQHIVFQTSSIAILCLLCSLATRAEFVPDFMPDDGGLDTSFIHNISNNAGTTPFLMRGSLQLPEIVIDPDTGLDYFHIVMGDPASRFMQDVYIERGFSSFQGGADNNITPLGPNAANGQANPRKVLGQIISDGEIYIDFIKDKFDRKTQNHTNANAARYEFNISTRHEQQQLW